MENREGVDANNTNSGDKIQVQTPSNTNIDGGGDAVRAPEGGTVNYAGADDNRTRRTPFTDLSQEEADLALARTLQEQERAYMMLRMNASGNHYGGWGASSYEYLDGESVDFEDPSEEENDGSNVGEDEDEGEDDEEDAFDVHADADADAEVENVVPQGNELDPSAYSSDEAYARALQDAEERDMAARLLALAGIHEVFVGEDEDDEDRSADSQDDWEMDDPDDPDELSYEELIALGEVVGTESRGLSADAISSLPSINYKSQSIQDGSSDPCVICRSEYEDGEVLTVLSCKHSYHSECITNWLQQSKVCPICNAEVSTSGNR